MRRLFHLIAGLLLVLIVAYLDRRRGIIFLSTLFVIAIIFETVRLFLPYINRIFFHHLNPLLRAEEKGKPTGAVYYLGGILLSLLLFEYEIALFSMTILAVGDPMASTAGKRFGRFYIRKKHACRQVGTLSPENPCPINRATTFPLTHSSPIPSLSLPLRGGGKKGGGEGKGEGNFRGKSLEGAVGFFIASIGAGLIFHGLWPALSIVIMITGVIAGTLTELLSNKVNDNLLIPIIASVAMEAVLFLLNLFKLY